jgi:hypothetical protein
MKRSTGSVLKDIIAVCVAAVFAFGAAFTGSLLIPPDDEALNVRQIATPAPLMDDAVQTFVS